MTSDSNAPQGDFAQLKSQIAENAASLSPENEVESLRERLDQVELLIEEFSQAREIQTELGEYIQDVKQESKDIRNYRFWLTVFALLMSASLFGMLCYCVFTAPEWFQKIEATTKIPFLIAVGGGSVFLMSLLLKGVYRSRNDRNKDDLLPDHLRQMIDAFKHN